VLLNDECLNITSRLITVDCQWCMFYSRYSWRQLHCVLSMLWVLHAYFTHLVSVVKTAIKNDFTGMIVQLKICTVFHKTLILFVWQYIAHAALMCH